MEQPHNIDQLFRERLQGAEAPPPAFVWPNIEEALRQRRRRFFFWLWFGLGLSGAGAWALWAAMQQHPATVPATNSPVASVPKTETARATGVGSVAGRDEDYARTSSSEKTTTTIDVPAGNTTKHPAKAASGTKKTFTSVAANAVKPAASPSGIVPSVKVLSPGNTIPQSTAASSSGNIAFADLRPLPSADDAPVSKKRGAAPVFPKVKPFIFKKKTPNKNCYNFESHKAVWLVDAYAGPSLPKRELKAAAPQFENYLGERRATEHAGWAFNAGLRGSLLFGRHFLLRSGLHYEQRIEIFKTIDTNYHQLVIRQTTQIIDNVPVTVIDTPESSYGDHYIKTFNRFGQLDIPLLAGVEFRHGRAGLSLQAGASINVYFWKRGTVLNTQGNPESFSPAKGTLPVYRRYAGWSTSASVQLFYHLRPRLRIFAEPYGSHQLHPLTLDGQPVSQRYTTWGLKLGLTQIFD